MPEVLRPEICVIGGGAGGLAAATSAAAFGVSVVLVEKGRLGGSQNSLLSSALATVTRRAREAAAAPAFGVQTISRVDFRDVQSYVRDVLARGALDQTKERIAALGMRVIEGAGHFTAPDTVAVGDDIEIKAGRFVVATGSVPALPPISGLDATPFLTPETVPQLNACPSHLIIIGAGRVGLEMAQAFRRLGAAVTVLDSSEPLGQDDPECTAFLLDRLTRQDGIVIRQGVSITLIGYGQSKVQVVLGGAAGGRTIEGSHLLVATGRRPNVDGLGLHQAGIEVGPHGIAVGKGLRTRNDKVYAIGDVAGAPHFVQAATYEASLVIRNALFRLPIQLNRDLVPRVIFTDPGLAHVGLTEAEARRRRRSIGVLRWPVAENDRVAVERATGGHIKVIISGRGDILGCTIVGPEAAESIVPWSLAFSQGLHIRAVAGVMMPYPAYAEIGKRAAMSYFSPSLTRPLVRRIINALRRFR